MKNQCCDVGLTLDDECHIAPVPNPTEEPPMTEVPLTAITVQLTGLDGNAFSILARVSGALRRGGRGELVEPFQSEATSSDYAHLLATCCRYVHVE